MVAGVCTGLVAPASRKAWRSSRALRSDVPVNYDGRCSRLRETEGLRRRRLVAYCACLLTATACQAATAKIRATFSGEKNSAGEITPAMVRANPSIAS